MNRRILAIALLLGLLAVPAATPAAASDVTTTSGFDAVIVVSETDLEALLTSGFLGEYTLVSAADLGLDEAALIGPGLFAEDTTLTPGSLGLESPDQGFFPGTGFGFSPFFTRFPISHVRHHLPFFRFHRHPIHCCVPPLFPKAAVVVVRPLPPPVVLPPPVAPVVVPIPVAPPVALVPPAPPVALPPPMAPGAMAGPGFPMVPIIPEADSLPLLIGGLAILGALAALRAQRRDT